MNRTHALLIAGGLTALMLATLLALGFGGDQSAAAISRLSAASAAETATPAITSTLPAETPADADALLEQNRQLREAVQVMQTREAQYLSQIEAANQALGQTQGDVAQGSQGEYDDHDEYGDDHDKYGDDDDHDDDDDDHDERDDHDGKGDDDHDERKAHD